jgi:basic membrane lipoprotein Med (substrate-binding protein (PBP1-ABC) superfamily)
MVNCKGTAEWLIGHVAIDMKTKKEGNEMKKISVVLIHLFLISLLFLMSAGIAGAAPEEKILKVAVPMTTTAENPWNRAMFAAFDKAEAMGYKFHMSYKERCTNTNIGYILRNYCEQGYDVIFEHSSTGFDEIKMMHKEYPEIAFVLSGAIYEIIQPNVAHYDINVDEVTYLMGVIAGMMTKTNTIGTISSFPNPQQREEINGFRRGALSVNPNIKFKLTYLMSWYDPARGYEAALAQINTGADFIYAEKHEAGVAKACREKGIYAFGNFLDQHGIAPDTIITSAVVDWSVMVTKVMDSVLSGNFIAKEYTYGLKEGGAAFAPYHAFENRLPKKVKDKVEEIKVKILDGTLVVPAERGKVKSD